MAKQCTSCYQVKDETLYYKRKNRPDRQPACKDCYRVKALKHNYGITKDEYNQMVTAQRGCCATCNRPSKLNVDHSHTSGNVRKLLCSNCNTALGLVKESIDTLSNLIMYVNHFSALAATNTNTAKQLEKVG